jgi:basic membrane protein A
MRFSGKFSITAGVALLAFVACGGGTKSGGRMQQGLDHSGENITVYLVDEGSGIDDKSFNSAAWYGITTFYGDEPGKESKRHIFYDEIFSTSPDLRLPNLRQASDENVDLIIATGFTFAEDLNQVAPAYPDNKYLIIDTVVSQPNVSSALFAEHEGAYLVGVAAALKAQEDNIANPSFGFVGGVAGSVITRFQLGFIQGVRSVLPDAEIKEYYANSWGDPVRGKTQAKQWYDDGVYAIFAAAGGTGNGVINQAKEYRLSGKNVWVIGVDSDQFTDGIYSAPNAPVESAVLTSMVKKVQIPVFNTLTDVKNGTFQSGTVIYNLAMDGVDFAKTNNALSSAIIEKINQVKQDIIDGKVTIISRVADAVGAGILPATSSARDDN